MSIGQSPEPSSVRSAAYGLGIMSVMPLPELALMEEESHIDVHIRLADVCPPEMPQPASSWFGISESDGYLHWSDVGTFHVRNGSEIVVQKATDIPESELRLFLLGPALALLLHQRGLLVLHASAISIDGHAVAFLGAQGRGKSTLAGALYARGHNLVADDIVAVDLCYAAQPVVFPGFPQLKLWPEAVSEIGETPDRLRRLHGRYDKRAYPATRGFSTAPLPLRCLYVLDEGAEARIEDLSQHAAFVELIRHTYTARVLEANPDPSHFRQCAAVASTLPVAV